MHCPNCGAQLADNQRFCPKCGTAVASGVSGQTQATQAMPGAPAGQSGQPGAEPLPANDVWSSNGMPTQAYDALSSGSYSTPDTGSAATNQGPAMSKDDFKRAKADYQMARRMAGKSHAPLIVAIVVAALLVAGASAAAVFFLVAQPAQNAQQELQAQIDELNAQLDDADQAAANAAASSQKAEDDNADDEKATKSTGSKYRSAVGTWKGTLLPTNDSDPCYGAEESPLQIAIKSIDDNGKAVMTVKALYHHHDEPGNAIQSSPEDMVIELKDVIVNLNNRGDFEYEVDLADYDIHEGNSRMVISGNLTVTDKAELTASVYSQAATSTVSSYTITDNFEMDLQD